MHINDYALDGISLAGDTTKVSDQAFFILCKGAFEILINGQKTEELYDTVKGVQESVLKNSVYGLCTLVIDYIQYQHNDKDVSGLLEDCQWHKERINRFLNLLKEHRTHLTIDFKRVNNSVSNIVDIDWKLDYQVKNNRLHSENGFNYLITLNTQEFNLDNQFSFSCSAEQLQDLVYKLKDAVKNIERETQR